MMTRHLILAAIMACSSVGATAAAQEPAPAPQEPLVCKRTLETGSLVRKRKQCMTKAQWEQVAASQKAGAQKMVDELTGRCGMEGGAC